MVLLWHGCWRGVQSVTVDGKTFTFLERTPPPGTEIKHTASTTHQRIQHQNSSPPAVPSLSPSLCVCVCFSLCIALSLLPLCRCVSVSVGLFVSECARTLWHGNVSRAGCRSWFCTDLREMPSRCCRCSLPSGQVYASTVDALP
jgi:hypothetical protein